MSPNDPEVVALEVLVDLKLDAGRSQDRADVVALLKRLDEAAYLHLEAAVRPTHGAELWRLREDALEELHWARENGGTRGGVVSTSPSVGSVGSVAKSPAPSGRPKPRSRQTKATLPLPMTRSTRLMTSSSTGIR